MIIPDFLFDFYRKVNYFGGIWVLFCFFILLDMITENMVYPQLTTK